MKRVYTIIGLVLYASSIVAQVPTVGLLFHYPLDGNINDASGNGEDGTSSYMTFGDDRFGNANSAYFNEDGNNSGVVNPTLYNNPQEFSVSYWFKTDHSGTKIAPDEYTVMSILSDNTTGTSFRHDRKTHMSPDGSIHANIYNGGSAIWLGTTTPYDNNTWHHLVMNLSSTDGFEFYVDGNLVDSVPAPVSAQVKNGYWRFGGWLVAGRNAYYGMLDDIRVYNRSLSEEEVQELYHENDYAIITDIDDIEYGTVTIGNQVWMKENLAYLPSVSPSSGESYVDPYYYVYGYEGSDVDEAKLTENFQTYGVLYNWIAAVNACPSGWRLPSDDDWKELELYIGMSQSEVDREGWRGTTEANLLRTEGGYGFAALEGGYRSVHEHFDYFDKDARWWSSTEYSDVSAWDRNLRDTSTRIARAPHNKTYGFYVRCIKDTPISNFDDLLAFYPFSGNANDESGNNHNGVVVGATLTEDRFGNINSAYDFEDWDDYIQFDNPPVLNTSDVSGVTISHWFTLQSLGANYNFYSYLNNELSGIISRYRPDYRKLSVTFMSDEFLVEEAMVKDQWYNLVFTADFNDNSAKVYLNGRLKVDSNIDSSRPLLDELHVGRHHLVDGSYGWYFNGNIDDIRIYSRTVSSDEAYSLYSEYQCLETVYDTIWTEVTDTSYISVYDTIWTEVVDTAWNYVNDTIWTEVFDTIWTEIVDTSYVSVNDTIWTEMTDTVFISVTDTLVIDVELTGIEPPDNWNTIRIYPNPAKDHLIIDNGDYKRMDGYILKVMNEVGTLVFETNIEDQIYELNLSDWDGLGLYYFQLIDSGGNIVTVRKIILE